MMCAKLLLVALLLYNGIILTTQNPLFTNYSSEVLRYAKVSQLKAYMDDETGACDNFYKYACGKWPRLQPATPNKQKTYYLQQLQQLFERQSVSMLKNENVAHNSVDRLIRYFYDSCIDRESLKTIGFEPIIKVASFYGGWPKVHFQTWYENQYDWLKTVAELRRKLGVNILIGMDIIPDFMDKNIQRIIVGAPKLDLQNKDEDEREEYEQYVAKKLRIYAPDMSRQWANEVAQQVVHIESQLLKGFPANASFTVQQTSRKRVVNNLKEAYGNYVDIVRYFNIIFNETIYQDVYEWPEDYFSNLVEVIRNTPKMKIANYTMWRVLQHFDEEADVSKQQNENWCALKIVEYFPKQLESIFNRNFNNMHVKNELQSIWADIKRLFREELQSTVKYDWITHDTRQNMIQKLEYMDLEIITQNEGALYQQIQNLVIHRGRFYENLIYYMQWKTQQQLAKLIEKPQENEEEIKLPKYVLWRNKIQLPATILHPRFFWDTNYPNALKYSSLGFLLAHEMVNAFDTMGSKYDKHGQQHSWWDSQSEYNYDEKTRCFLNEQTHAQKYHGKDVPDNIQALLTSIRDSGGLSIAHRVYKKWWDNIGEERIKNKEILPNLKLNNNQLFFINFAQLMCADYHDSLNTIEELPEELRVNNAVSNNMAFAQAFACPRESPMNPSKKCKIF